MVAVKAETGSGQPSAPYRLEEGGHVAGVERVGCVDEQESLFLIVFLRCLLYTHCMDNTIDTEFEACTEVVNPAYLYGFGTGSLQDALCEELMPNLADTNRSNPRVFI